MPSGDGRRHGLTTGLNETKIAVGGCRQWRRRPPSTARRVHNRGARHKMRLPRRAFTRPESRLAAFLPGEYRPRLLFTAQALPGSPPASRLITRLQPLFRTVL